MPDDTRTPPTFTPLTADVIARATDELRTRWATAIREGRARSGLSQPRLARRLDVAQSTVAMWERGHSLPSDLVKPRVIAFLGLDAADLLAPLAADKLGAAVTVSA